MKIVIDEKIPFLFDTLTDMGHSVVALPGVDIKNADLLDTEVLFVRTRTKCNEALLAGSAVRFIGTATIGYDHIDVDYCASHGISWSNAAGCNADAVLQYVQSVVYAWASDEGVALHGLTIGVVGVGEIGSRVARWASDEGLCVLLNDPPRESNGETGFSPLAILAERCDIITFHPTLSRGGDFPSYHLADEAFLSSLKKCRLLINASRGQVVDNDALLRTVDKNSALKTVLDVWENEPAINLSLLNKVYIATPHIAGYSAEGKINATNMVLRAFATFFDCPEQLPTLSLPVPSCSVVEACSYSSAALAIYDPRTDSAMLKAHPAEFENLRNNYNLRREPSAFEIKTVSKVR